MLIIALLSVLVGMVLGQRFKVVILVLPVSVTLLWAGSAAFLHAQPIALIGEIAGAVIAGLQLGYFFGIGILYFRLLARTDRRRTALLHNGLSTQRSAH
jgi:CHASE2 domain-containing sensor protein